MVLNNRYSQHARRALNQARLLAQDYQHEVVDTDHLLVGILREHSSLGSRVLRELDIDARRAELEVRVLHAVADLLVTPLNLTAELRQVLTLSVNEAHWFGHHYIGTEHLLLALARSRAGGALALMHTLAISSDQIRRRVRLLLSEGVTELSIEGAKRSAHLSELSRRALNAAAQLATQCGDDSPGLEHLMLVLARERRSPASRILHQYGLDQAALEAEIKQVGAETERNAEGLLEDVIDHAVDRADQLGMHYTGTDHILLALAENPHGATLLQKYDIEAQHIIAAIYHDLAPPPHD
jgi:ATP-dependent Clp protease ATP-binding subunit ClpA